VPEKIECAVFSDKESAARWVNLEHTGENDGVGVLNWDSVQKRRFESQYTEKKPSRSIQLFDLARENGVKFEKVDSTTLDRITGTPYVRKEIGVSFPNGILDLEKNKDQILRNLKKVFSAMSDDKFKVGSVYTSDQSKEWIKKILNITSKEEKDTNDVKEGSKKKPKKEPLDGKWISMQLYSSYPKQDRVKALLKELKELDPYDKPNVCAPSLRVLLELGSYIFLKERGDIKKIVDEEKKRVSESIQKGKNVKPIEKDWSPSFAYMLGYILNEDNNIISDPQERKATKVLIGKKSNEPFLTELNLFTHNPNYEPSGEALIGIWKGLGKPLFKVFIKKDEDNK
jgi:hypothetical protein